MMPINSHEFVYIPNQRFLLDKMTWKSTSEYNIGKQKTQNFMLYVWSLTLLTYLVISSNINLLFLKSFL